MLHAVSIVVNFHRNDELKSCAILNKSNNQTITVMQSLRMLNTSDLGQSNLESPAVRLRVKDQSLKTKISKTRVYQSITIRGKS